MSSGVSDAIMSFKFSIVVRVQPVHNLFCRLRVENGIDFTFVVKNRIQLSPDFIFSTAFCFLMLSELPMSFKIDEKSNCLSFFIYNHTPMLYNYVNYSKVYY